MDRASVAASVTEPATEARWPPELPPSLGPSLGGGSVRASVTEGATEARSEAILSVRGSDRASWCCSAVGEALPPINPARTLEIPLKSSEAQVHTSWAAGGGLVCMG